METGERYRKQIFELRSTLREVGSGRKATRLRGRISRLCALAVADYQAGCRKTPKIRRQMNAVLRLQRDDRILESRDSVAFKQRLARRKEARHEANKRRAELIGATQGE